MCYTSDPLAYFRPLVKECQTHPVPDGHLDHLRLKLRQTATLAPNLKKCSFVMTINTDSISGQES